MKKTILLALAFLAGMFATDNTTRRDDNKRQGFNFLPVLCIVMFSAIMTACGGGGGGGSTATPVTVQIPSLEILNAPDIYASHLIDGDNSYILEFERSNSSSVSINCEGNGEGNVTVFLQRMQVARCNVGNLINLPKGDRMLYHNPTVTNAILVENGMTVILQPGEGQIFFQGQPQITALVQLCPASWLATYINANFPGTTCPSISGTSFSPDMRRVVIAAMADGFSPGLSFTDSPLGFFGRYDGDDRAAGFTYNFDTFALRTDYTRLPSKQDSNVWLDTYRLGVLRPVNDEARFFAGVDNYKNAIFVLDTTGENLHRFGVAVGEGYAVKYEYRLNL